MALFGRPDPPPPPPPPPSGTPGGSVIPRQAIERLREMRGSGQTSSLFTSDLSVNEFLLVKRAGFEPLGLVVGSSIYHVGYQRGQWTQNMELTVLSQAMYTARDLAMTRMEEEADQLGADGVVGVRLEVGRYEWGAHLAEFLAIGTAVRHGAGDEYRAPNGRPFTSDLSGQDMWTLLAAGYRPAGLVMGTCVYHVAHQGMRAVFRQMGQNVEMENFTQALYDARELAMERMQAEAIALGAAGIVGVQLTERSHGWGSHVIEFFSLGTAVLPTREDHKIPTPNLVISLDGGNRASIGTQPFYTPSATQ